MEQGEREKYQAALRAAKLALIQAKEHVLGTGWYARYFPIFKKAVEQIDACQIGPYDNDITRLEKLLQEVGLPYDKSIEGDHIRIDVEDGSVTYDECGRLTVRPKQSHPADSAPLFA